AHAVQLVGARVHGGIGGAEGRTRVLPFPAVAAPRPPAHLVGQRNAPERHARSVETVPVRREGELGGGGSREQRDEQRQGERSIHEPLQRGGRGRRRALRFAGGAVNRVASPESMTGATKAGGVRRKKRRRIFVASDALPPL